MNINHEIKSHLARLLATEDLVVEHKSVETACFNVHTRVLTLPMWEKASSTVYDLLVGHEVGHALYTPDEDWTETHSVPPQFVNVVEDARIEKLMKRRYAGLSKTFYGGYKELADDDFFGISDENVNALNLADKANLYFKIGNFLAIDFNAEEQGIIETISNAETFPEVLDAAKLLYEYCRKQQQEQTKIQLDSHEQTPSGSSTQGELDLDMGEQDETEGKGEQSQDDVKDSDAPVEKSQPEQKTEQTNTEGGKENNPEVKTMNSLEDSLKNLTGNERESVYLELPQLDLSKIIVPVEDIRSKIKDAWQEYSPATFYDVDKEFNSFKTSAQKEVNYLVKEFECRKAADSYARATVSKTGVLDTALLHSYKFNEDVFKKVTTLADGKNHGLIFVLDWSGSMGNVMLDTVKQLFNLVWFCKKVSIPFEVYAFTSDYPIIKYNTEDGTKVRELAYQKKDGLIQVGEWFSMMNLLSSKMRNNDFNDQVKNLFRIAYSFRFYSSYKIPMGMSLSGTPLNESLISLHQILPKFQREHKLQKVQCVVLTDGEACGVKYHREIKREWENEPYIGTANINYNSFLRDRKTGYTYKIGGEWWKLTDILLRNLKDKFKDTNFIGIRILEGRDAGHFVRRYCGYYGEEYERVMNSWRKDKSFSIKSSGYSSYFGLSSSALNSSTEFVVKEDASKTQIKAAFAKSLNSKKMNKKILGEFISLVA